MTPETAWNALPRPVRTVLNVGLSGSAVVVIAAVIGAHGVLDVDWAATGRTALDAFGFGVATAAGRALNPWDREYGWKRSAAPTTGGAA